MISTLIGSTSTNIYVSSYCGLNYHSVNILLEKAIFNLFGNLFNNILNYQLVILLFTPIILFKYYRHPKSMTIGLIAIIWQMIVFLFIYSDFAAQKTNTIFLVILFIIWINLEEKNDNSKYNMIRDIIHKYTLFIITTALIIMDIYGLDNIKCEIKYQYSDSFNTAQYINNNLENESVLICTDIPRASSIIPYVNNMKFINSANFKEFTYVTWDKYVNEKIEMDEIIEKTIKMNKDNSCFYLIESIFSPNESEVLQKYQDKGILSKALYITDLKCNLGDESFRIYKFNFDDIEKITHY